MLRQISCDEFKSQNKKTEPVVFHNGLNIISGNNEGSNSIGKSTMLMIIDFVFGGDDYVLKLTDVQEKIGHHTIKFCFEFDGEFYYFSRNTLDYTRISICDSNYMPEAEMSKDEFRRFLLSQYKIDLPNINFRGIVGKFFRIYKRENDNENLPLKNAEDENTAAQITGLLKLHNRYTVISELQNLEKKKKDEKNAYTKAQKHNLIPKATVTELKRNERTINELQKQLLELSVKSGEELLGLNSNQVEVIAELKGNLATVKRHRGRILSQIRAIENNISSCAPNLQCDFAELGRFFPTAKIEKFEEIERFHAQLTSVLSQEYTQTKDCLTELIQFADIEIKRLENEIKERGLPVKVSRPMLDTYSAISAQIDKLQNQKKVYDELKAITIEVKEISVRLVSLQEEQIVSLQNEINQKLKEFNDFIYDGKYEAPVLTISKPNKYHYATPYDTGTGIAYKGLILFDLVALSLTPLPAVIHDSMLFKNIATVPIEKIFELYITSGKQIFVAFDKTKEYTDRTQQIITENTVLTLSDNGNQLFGRGWNEKSQTAYGQKNE